MPIVPSVRLSADGFTLRAGLRLIAVNWAEVVAIHGKLLSKVTFDECFLVFQGGFPDAVSIGELDDGFAEFEHEILDRYPSIPANWRSLVEAAGYNSLRALWPDSDIY